MTTTGGLFVNYLPEPTAAVYNVSADCDALAQRTQITRQNEKFSVYCGIDLSTGDGVRDAGDNEVTLADITGVVAYTLGDCLQACSSK